MTLTHLRELLAITEAQAGKTMYVAVPGSARKANAKTLGDVPAEAYFIDHGYGIDWGSHEIHRDDKAPGPVAKGELTVPDAKILRGYDEILEIARAGGVEFEGGDGREPFYCAAIDGTAANGGGGQYLDLVFVPAFMKALKAAGYETIGGDRTITNGSDECVMIVDPSQFKITGYQDGPPFDY